MLSLFETNKINFLNGVLNITSGIKNSFANKDSLFFITLFFALGFFSYEIQGTYLSMYENAPVDQNGKAGISLSIMACFIIVFLISLFKIFSPIIMAVSKQEKNVKNTIFKVFKFKTFMRFLGTMMISMMLFLFAYKATSLEADIIVITEQLEAYQMGKEIFFEKDFQLYFTIKVLIISFLLYLFFMISSFSYYIMYISKSNIGFINSLKIAGQGCIKNILPLVVVSIVIFIMIFGIYELQTLVNNDIINIFIDSVFLIVFINIWYNFSISIYKEADS